MQDIYTRFSTLSVCFGLPFFISFMQDGKSNVERNKCYFHSRMNVYVLLDLLLIFFLKSFFFFAVFLFHPFLI